MRAYARCNPYPHGFTHTIPYPICTPTPSSTLTCTLDTQVIKLRRALQAEEDQLRANRVESLQHDMIVEDLKQDGSNEKTTNSPL